MPDLDMTATKVRAKTKQEKKLHFHFIFPRAYIQICQHRNERINHSYLPITIDMQTMHINAMTNANTTSRIGRHCLKKFSFPFSIATTQKFLFVHYEQHSIVQNF